MTSLKVERVVRTLRELTLEKMREAIWSGHFRPGERLVERSLCEQLAVSRSVVREVLRHLETEGLVDSIAQQGPVVATIDAATAAQIYEIRALLEGHAARLCAQRAGDAALRQLARLNEHTHAAFARDDHPTVLKRTHAFYEKLFAEAGMGIAWNVVQSLNSRISLLRAMTIASEGRKAESAAEMARIVEALKKRDPQAAEEASQAHVRRVAQIAAAALAATAESGGAAARSRAAT